jgi:exopolysaccharide biosynthesis polyprenyl glycosylphosphotransferase
MLREQAKTFGYALRSQDAAIVVFSFILTCYLISPPTADLEVGVTGRVDGDAATCSFVNCIFACIKEHLGLIILLVPTWIMLLKYQGAYRSFRRITYVQEILKISRANFTGVSLLFPLIFITKSNGITVPFIFCWTFTTLSLLILGRTTAMFIMRRIRRRGLNWRTVLIVGTGIRARTYAARITNNQELGLKIVGYVDDQPRTQDREILGDKIIGTLKDVPTIIERQVIDEVVIALPLRLLHGANETVTACEEQGVQVTVAADLFETSIAKPEIIDFYGLPMISLSTTPAQQLQVLVKECFDRIAGVFLILLTSPILIASAVAIWWTSGGPVFFKQIRCGLHGRKFTIYKFRTMQIDAEARLEELKKFNSMSGPVFKMKEDPRVTPFGNLLRKNSLDELPQLFNVIKGEMSLVGPRPPVPGEIDQYDRWQRRRLSVKPGITGIWQVSGRNSIDFQKWMELDLYYIDHWSLWLDFRILMQTTVAVLRRRGAY